MSIEITPEVIEALRTLRRNAHSHGMDISTGEAFDILDNAGVFSAVDEATGYDIDPSPDASSQVSKCTCPLSVMADGVGHLTGCPGDPAEWGDMAYTTAPTAADNVRRAVGLTFE